MRICLGIRRPFGDSRASCAIYPNLLPFLADAPEPGTIYLKSPPLLVDAFDSFASPSRVRSRTCHRQGGAPVTYAFHLFFIYSAAYPPE